MAEVNKQNLEKAERILCEEAKSIRKVAAELAKKFLVMCSAETNEESKKILRNQIEDLNLTIERIPEDFDNRNLKEEFKERLLSIVSKNFENHPTVNSCEISFIAVFLPFTRDEITRYEGLEGEERQKYVDELYMRKLCEILKED